MNSLHFLLTERQQRLLAAVLLRPERDWSLSDLMEVGGPGHGSTQQFLKHLLDAGLVLSALDRRRRRYRANTHHPIYPELTSICRKTFGVKDVVAGALAPFRNRIDEAFILGSIAKGTEGPDSDIDVMVIGNVRPTQLLSAQQSIESNLGREVHFSVYGRREWTELKASDPVISAIVQGPKLDLDTA